MRNRLLSFILAFSVFASAFAGAFAVNVKNADAMTEANMSYSSLYNILAPQFNESANFVKFMHRVEDILNGEWYDENANNITGYCVCVLQNYNDLNDICICIYKTTWADFADWYANTNLNPNKTIQRRTSPSVAYQDSFGTMTDYLYCGDNGQSIRFEGSTTYANSLFTGFESGSNQKYFSPSPQNIFSEDMIFYYYGSAHIYINGITELPFSLAMSFAPVSAYNNIIMIYNGRCYFTISEQDILYSHVGQQINKSVSVTALNNDGDSWSVNLYISDLNYTGLSTWNGVTPVQGNPILGWDITEYVNSFDWDIITYSCFNPLEETPTLFADNEAIIPFEPKTDMWAYWYEKMENLFDYTNTPHEVIPDTVPSYVSQKVSSQYLNNIKVHVHGFVCFDGELPTPSFDQILVISEAAFDQFIINLEVVQYGVNNFRYNFLSELLQQCDLICIVSDSDFSEIVTDHADNPAWADNYIYYQQASINIGDYHLNHGLWYMTHAELSTGHPSSTLKSCYSFVTQRYITKCNYWVLSDGIDLLYKGLNAIHDDQTSYFDSAIDGFMAVSASVYASCETLGGKIDLLYNLLSKDYVTKLDSIIDKLDSIVYNTSEEERGFWILPVYEFIEQFVPSISSFGNWIGAIEDFGDSLPVVPQLTIPVFPSPVVTVPVIEGG